MKEKAMVSCGMNEVKARELSWRWLVAGKANVVHVEWSYLVVYAQFGMGENTHHILQDL
jgi:hypothetical protein